MELKPRFFKPPSKSFFLFGARGTGKTTWIKQDFKDAIYIDLLSPESYRLFSAKPERLQELISGHSSTKTVIIDEIQKVPELLGLVHQLIEKTKSLKFILTGSSSRKLKRSGVDLLAGRALLKTLHPFMAAELGADFDLDFALQRGLLPLVWGADDPEDVLKAYVALYLREEVQMEGLVRNVGNFSRFLEAVSFSHGSLLNTSQVARDCQVERKTVEGYIEILEDLLLAFRLPVFNKRAKRRISQHPKFYYFDTGVFKSIRPKGPLDAPEEIGGAALEGLVGQHLRSWNAYSRDEHELFFWRTKSGVEVDFIFYGPQEFLAIEVKNSKIIRSRDLNGLITFHKDYPQATPLFLYRGDERLKINDILCLPCDDFLRSLVPGRSINLTSIFQG